KINRDTRLFSVSIQAGAWIILVQAFARTKKTKAPNSIYIKFEAVSSPQQLDSVSFNKECQEK
ncbi:hypothetical protein DDT83_18610, partial [Proteus mirabilis]|nr:hypothetical protein [Proteus mirabilis]